MRTIYVSCGLAYYLLASSPVFGQGAAFNRDLWNRPSAASRPAISPYLNLLRSGGTTAGNYYGLVRPQVDFRNGINNLQQDVQGLGSSVSKLNNQLDTTIHETGHRAGFMTHGSSFMSLGGGSSGGSAMQQGGRSSQVPSARPSSSGRGGSSVHPH